MKLCTSWQQNFQWIWHIQNSKHATRNSKQIQNVPNSIYFSLFGGFEPLDFEFVSDFDIRISDFLNSQASLVPAMPD